MSLPTWSTVAAVDWNHAPDDWEHVALASYADQLPEFWSSGPAHAATREAVLRFLERHRAGVGADYPRSQLFRGGRRARERVGGLRGRARRRAEVAARHERQRRREHARTQARDELGQFRRRGED